MQNMKIYRKTTILALATTITLLTGCTGQKEEEGTAEPQETIQPVEFYLSDGQEQLTKTDDECRHLIVYFGEQAVVLRQCEGYNLSIGFDYHNSAVQYSIGGDYRFSKATNYDFYITDHQDAYMVIENAAIEQGAKVLKIK